MGGTLEAQYLLFIFTFSSMDGMRDSFMSQEINISNIFSSLSSSSKVFLLILIGVSEK